MYVPLKIRFLKLILSAPIDTLSIAIPDSYFYYFLFLYLKFCSPNMYKSCMHALDNNIFT